jgi:hypothetical protein
LKCGHRINSFLLTTECYGTDSYLCFFFLRYLFQISVRNSAILAEVLRASIQMTRRYPKLGCSQHFPQLYQCIIHQSAYNLTLHNLGYLETLLNHLKNNHLTKYMTKNNLWKLFLLSVSQILENDHFGDQERSGFIISRWNL